MRNPPIQQQGEINGMKMPPAPPAMLPMKMEMGGKGGKEPGGNLNFGGKGGKGGKGAGGKPPPKGGNRHDSESDSWSDSDSASTYSWSTGTGSRSSASRYRRAPNHDRRRSHHRYEQRHFIDDTPQIAYAPQYPREGQHVLAYNPYVENYVPVVPAAIAPRPLLHQRPMEDNFVAELRRADEYRRDAEEYVRARHRAIDEAKYRDRRRFDGFF